VKGVSTVSEKKPQKKPPYVRLADRVKGGEYELVEPLDYLILEMLQDEGELMGGYYPLTTSITALRKAFKELNAAEPNLLANRVRVLALQGLTIKVRIAGAGKNGWQRTKAGKELADKWRTSQTQ
jgi:hypothetical protein